KQQFHEFSFWGEFYMTAVRVATRASTEGVPGNSPGRKPQTVNRHPTLLPPAILRFQVCAFARLGRISSPVEARPSHAHRRASRTGGTDESNLRASVPGRAPRPWGVVSGETTAGSGTGLRRRDLPGQ